MQYRRYTLTKSFPNGDLYNGEATGENIKDGQGEFFWANTGATYTGAWVNDKPHGKGKYVFPGEMGYTYEGDFVNGERSGKGICTFSNGKRYEGEWLGDEMHGSGQLTGASGVDDYAEYIGPFIKGERSGAEGVCNYANGDVYKGSWLNNKRHGYGVLQLNKSSSTPGYVPKMGEAHVVSYKGEFQNDLPKGTGEFKYSDGSSYRGECEGYWRHGIGEHQTVKGDLYKGSFNYDKRHGKGVLKSLTGEYDGYWVDDILEGHVIFKADKSVAMTAGLIFYEGPCVKGDMTGKYATAKYRDGSLYKGEIFAGKPNGKGILENKRMTIPCIGEVILCYEGEFSLGVPKGKGEGKFTIITPDSRPTPSSPISEEIKGFLPSYDTSGNFTGLWVNGLPNGEGEWHWEKEQQHYHGIVKTGIPQGFGKFSLPNIHYEGNFNLGFPDGQGSITWKIGEGKFDTYSGNWKEGYLDGEGKLTLNNGISYVGCWKMGVKEGRGVENAPRDYRYSGEFKNGKRHGQGILRLENENATYEGEFVAGEFTGHGKASLDDGTVIKGEFLNGKPHGLVEVNIPKQGIFQGEFKNGKVSGSGIMKYPNGDTYKGSFIDSGGPMPLRHGQGVYTFLEGNILECTWKRNVLHGEGIYITSTGDRSTRSYVEGVVKDLQSTGNGVFSPENEFPNTLSEEMLKERRQQRISQRPSLVSVRRSLPKRPSGDGCLHRNNKEIKIDMKDEKNFITSSILKSAVASEPKATDSVSPTAEKKLSPIIAANVEQDANPLVVKYKSPLCTVRRKVSPRKDETKENIDKEKSKDTNREFNEVCTRFQKGINHLLGSSIAQEGKIGTNETSSASYFSAPEKDGLMKRASALRNPKEDEIHFLTEELRQLNERIWQLNFMVSTLATEGGNKDNSTLTDDSRMDLLKNLQESRRGVAEKIYSLTR